MQVSRVKANDRLLITTNKGSGLLQACLSELFYNCYKENMQHVVPIRVT